MIIVKGRKSAKSERGSTVVSTGLYVTGPIEICIVFHRSGKLKILLTLLRL